MTLHTLCLTALVATLSAGAAGCGSVGSMLAGPPATPQTITNPQWVKRPTQADIQNIYPVEARRMQVNGEVKLQCVVQQEGGLRPCTVLSETPAAMGFGEAALKAAPFFQIATRTEDGHAVRGASVTVPVVFTVAPA